ncbi:ABC transporter [Oceanicoccus sagamiensis]|uniref:ABC transporter n=2 Tax=Oceanicoccus sagamiensis TaxID=716816 RepID=A0A1X9ND82_9GAMM|nr:ABC transporter [Oceanicoccus sagamiensis]
MTVMINAKNIEKTVATSEGSLCILKGIDLEIKQGETLAIVGSSGSGKSTLLGLLAGLDIPSSGSITLDGRDITALTEDERATVRADLVGFVFQSFQLLPSLTALENVMLPAELNGVAGARGLAEKYLQRVGLDHRFNHYPKQLSGGEQQRVALARAFASQPQILFADEPTGNLDTATGAQVIDLLFELNREEGATLVLVTHEQRLADRCQRSIQLEGGEIVADKRNKPSVVASVSGQN